MKHISRMILAICLPLLFCCPVMAEHSGTYVGAFLGGNALMDAKCSGGSGSFQLKFDPGILGSAVVGWDFAKGDPSGEGRIELEYSRRSNPLDKARFIEGEVKGSGDVTSDSVLINFYGVIHDDRGWAPYIGAGLGAARIETSNLKVTGQPLSIDSDVVFACQLGAGVDYALTDRLSLDFGYRFFSSSRPKFSEANSQTFKMDFLNHSAVFGLRVGF